MSGRERSGHGAARQAEQRGKDVENLRMWERAAEEQGCKLHGADRLKAALHLTRAWRKANAAGLRKEDFQDAVLARLKRPHARREAFKLANWVLPRHVESITPKVVEDYGGKTEPLRALEPYLVGVSVAATHCGVDPDDWKLNLIRELSIWARNVRAPEVAEDDDRPAETLSLLLNELCRAFAARNRLGPVFEVVRSVRCGWDMFDERLVTGGDMQQIDSPISPTCESGLYFADMFPFPSIPLLRVPYLVGSTDFALAPAELLRRRLDRYAEDAGERWWSELKSFPDDVPSVVVANGRLIYFRELRLCVVPDGHGRFCAAIESRPRVKVTFAEGTPFAGNHYVHRGYEPDLWRDRPTVRSSDGCVWSIRYAHKNFWQGEWLERDPNTTGWQFDYDPVRAPGETPAEPWYLSYTPATPAYLKHWFVGSGSARDWTLGDADAECPWSHSHWEDERYGRDLPLIHEMNFPDSSFAASIERCLHNGLIEEALQDAVTRLTMQVANLQNECRSARDAASQRLISRWNRLSCRKD